MLPKAPHASGALQESMFPGKCRGAALPASPQCEPFLKAMRLVGANTNSRAAGAAFGHDWVCFKQPILSPMSCRSLGCLLSSALALPGVGGAPGDRAHSWSPVLAAETLGNAKCPLWQWLCPAGTCRGGWTLSMAGFLPHSSGSWRCSWSRSTSRSRWCCTRSRTWRGSLAPCVSR